MNPFGLLDKTILGNRVEEYLIFLCILLIGFLVKKVISKLVTTCMYQLTKRYGKSVGKQKFIQLLGRPIEVFVVLIILYFAFDRLILPAEWKLVSKEEFGIRKVLDKGFQLMFLLSVIWIILRVVDLAGLYFLARAKKTATMDDDQLVPFVKEAVKFFIVAISGLIILGVTFNLDIVSLVTGLGIGGLALALAAKETLENLMGSFTIFLDKPFVTGDNVIVGSIEGKVESVGFRSTRLRSVDKMLVTVPNKKMVDAELINDTERTVRRTAFSIIISQDTDLAKIQEILPELKRKLNDNLMIDRGSEIVRFRNISTSGFEIYVAYVVLTPDLNEFLGIKESVNFEILTTLKNHSISLAVPLSTPEILPRLKN